MVDDNHILSELKRFFGDGVISAEDTMPFDFVVKTEDKTILCYVVVKDQDVDYDKYLLDIAKKIRDFSTNEASVILITEREMDLNIGLLCYWEYGKYMYNRDINWRPLDQETVDWLLVQLKAKRMRIKFLPEKFFRIIKTIRLNATTLTEAEIVYFRRFTDKYKMDTKLPISDEERFNRMLTGTPEEEYPRDELDDLILMNVQKYYPSASIKSHSLLFDIDLLNLRLYKEKLCTKDTIAFKDIYRNINQISLECYYYPNFRYIRNKPRVSNIIDVVSIENRSLCETYEPLSALNI